MNIVGLIGIGQNPAACIVQNGVITAFAEEERFTRIKGSDGMLPVKAILSCLKSTGLKWSEVDRLAFGWDCNKYPFKMLGNFGKNYLKYKRDESKACHFQKDTASLITAIKTLSEFHPLHIKSKITEDLLSAGLKPLPKIEFVPHHIAHAYSTYFCSPFSKAGILTMDGSGEDIATQLAIGDGDSIRILESISIPHSIGWFYAAITEYLGFIPNRDEGKLMGLASYGEERKKENKWKTAFEEILNFSNHSYHVNPIYTKFGSHSYGNNYTDELVNFLTKVDADAKPISYGMKTIVNGTVISKYLQDVYVDIAWAAQNILEKTAVKLAKRLVNEYKLENLCISGGVAQNCKMNGEILKQSGCKNIFVQPAANDSGSAMGAALYIAQQNGCNIRNQLHDVYKGPEFSNDDILDLLKTAKIKYLSLEDPSETAANLLAKGKLLGWFQGRMEFGPRALGNRSILANPVQENVKDKINKEVKFRECWRPYCPSLIEEAERQYIKSPNETKFMIVAYDIMENVRETLSSVSHIDGTVRPQTVSEKNNPLYYNLIKNLGIKTGHPVVLNTSFNIRGEPIVCSPIEALRCFYSNGLDALIMGNFLVEK